MDRILPTPQLATTRDTEMDGELRWARDLAGDALEDPQDTMRDQRLPSDVLAIVAEALAGERDLHTLSNLNMTSHQVHLATLPVLYETVNIADEQAFERSVGSTVPKGWKYVKFLFVTSVTLPLLRLHLRTYTHNMPDTAYEFATSFPRLILLGSTDDLSPSPTDGHDHPLQITIYKPIRFSALLSACINYGDAKGFGKRCGISFFGTYYLGHNAAGEPNRIKPTTFRDIVRLDVHPGACILREKQWSTTAMQGWHTTFVGVNFELVIAAGDAEQIGLEETLRILLEHLALYATSLLHQNHIRFKVKCAPRILDKMTELYDHVQPCFLDFDFTLTSHVDKEDMKRYFRALAAIYSPYWATHAHSHDPTKELRFTDINAPATALHPVWVEEYELDANPEAEQYWSGWGGNMWCGPGDVPEWFGESDAEDEREEEEGTDDEREETTADDMENDDRDVLPFQQQPLPPTTTPNRNPLAGFEVNLYRTLMYKDEYQDGHMIWARGYPVVMPEPATARAVPANAQARTITPSASPPRRD